ncbi:MAG: MFS transporter [Ornithinimicrobium sp.]|uniref:MFS transporter n=1 Tax=Ornithinimicrobium sp. TaxID=1977084 RepID=UPI0026E011C3|nr:MFS transporter [Ornithinimicrobium sp.]MDO5739000.1 MFS transporter [Ornithinimicrobium sp.]
MTLPVGALQLAPRARTLAFVALIMGGVGIGITEFVTMGLLPQIADGVVVSIPAAGHTISAYAVGVVVGAPLVALGAARLPRRGVLLVLMVLFAIGNALSALAPTYGTLIGARFLAGLPHGGYFALASLVAVGMVPKGQGGRAVGTVMLGIPIAMVIGVPLGTWAGQILGWRIAYWACAVIGILTVVLIRMWVPHFAGERDQSWRTELRAFGEVQFWLALLTGAVGFGGIFAMYSYIAPTITEVTGLHQSWVPVFLLAYGLASIVGTWLGGRLSDWSILRTLALTGLASAVSLLAFWQTSRWALPALLTVCLIAVAGSGWVVTLQLRLMSVAGDAKTIGAAMNHSALNIANALGAWLGGLVITAGYGYRAPSLVGAALSIAGLLVLGTSLLIHRRQRR